MKTAAPAMLNRCSAPETSSEIRSAARQQMPRFTILPLLPEQFSRLLLEFESSSSHQTLYFPSYRAVLGRADQTMENADIIVLNSASRDTVVVQPASSRLRQAGSGHPAAAIIFFFTGRYAWTGDQPETGPSASQSRQRSIGCMNGSRDWAMDGRTSGTERTLLMATKY